jgi:hypothetical protein
MKSSFKTALIAAVVSAFVAAGAAVATTKTFVLGTTNTVDAASTVTAGASGLNARMLQLTNNSTGSSATALGLTTPGSRPPMIVSSGAKVATLNVDKLDGRDSGYFLPTTGTAANSAKLGGQLPGYYLPATGKAADSERLDGIDSTGFVQGRGTALANRLVFVPADHKTLLPIPGLGYLEAFCTESGAEVDWVNNTGSTVDAWYDRDNSHFDGGVVGPGIQVFFLVDTGAGRDGGTLALGVGNDPGARRTALLHMFAFQASSDAPCGFQVQGTLWTSQ